MDVRTAKGPVLKTGEIARCREFESRHFRHLAQIAQSVEQGTENPCVRGSIPRLGTIRIVKNVIYSANQCLC